MKMNWKWLLFFAVIAAWAVITAFAKVYVISGDLFVAAVAAVITAALCITVLAVLWRAATG